MSMISAFITVDKTAHNSRKFAFTLSSINYGYWKTMIEPFLITNNLIDYVDGSIPCPSKTLFVTDGVSVPKENPNYPIWVSNDAHVRMLIISTISEASFRHVQGTTSVESLLSLKKAYAPYSTSREYTLKTQILRIKMHGDETPDAYLNRAQEYADALAAIGEPIKDKDLVMLVVSGLREEYNGLKTTITARQSPTTFSELHALLSNHDYMLGKTRTPIAPYDPQAFYDARPSNNNRSKTNLIYRCQQLSRVASRYERRWVYRLKRDNNGAITRYKARFVAKGFWQQPGIDFHETFRPVAKSTTVRAVLSLAVTNNWPLHQLDIQNAFLHGNFKEQALRAWFKRLSKALFDLGFNVSKMDPSLFIYSRRDTLLYILVYVDDIIVTGNNKGTIDNIICQLGSAFALKDLGPLNYFLGIEIVSHVSDILLSQKKYILELLQSAGLSNYNPMSYPMVTSSSLNLDDSTAFSNPVKYRQVVGSLQYVTLSRPDIAFAVNKFHVSSTEEAEYKLLADTVVVLTMAPSSSLSLWFSFILTLYYGCDNSCASTLSLTLFSLCARTKHVEIDYHFILEKVAEGDLRV
ncbi:retrovirus-related pol polyprotein from transposon TNT 1-94 [Tanacetum coccineum]